MNLINDRCSRIQHNFYCLHLNLEYVSTDKDLQRLLGPQTVSNVFRAMRRPTLLTEVAQRALDIYEDHIVGFLVRHKGAHIEC